MAKRTSSSVASAKSFFNLLQFLVRASLFPLGGITLAAGNLTYICMRDNLPEILPYSIKMTLASLAGIMIAIYAGFFIEVENKPDKPRNKFRLTVNSVITCLLIVCTAITVHVYFEYNEQWSDYTIAAFAAFIGVFFAFNFNIILDNLRKRDRRDRLLRDIYFELKGNSDLLVGKGFQLNNDVWDSGKSAGLIQELTSYQLRQSSTIYHYLDISMREADYCRQAGEEHSMIPAIENRRKQVAKERFEKLRERTETREAELRERINALLNEDFWEKAGVRENEV